MILVHGVTGSVGSEVVWQLGNKGKKVRVLVRAPSEAQKIVNSGADIVKGDLEQPNTLTEVFKGVVRLFLASPPHRNQLVRESNAIEISKLAGVRHIVKLSCYGAGINCPFKLGRMYGEIEKKIEDSGIPYTHLRPHFYMQNLLMYADAIKHSGSFYAPMKSGKIGMVHVKDIAAVAVAVLTEAGHMNKIYEITGPEAVSFRDVADRLSKVTGEDIEYVYIPPSAAKAGMLAAGIPEWFAEALLEQYEAWSTDEASTVSDTVARVTGRWPIPLEKFLGENRGAFA